MENMKDLVCNNFIRLADASPLKKREIAKLIGVNENTLQRWKNKETYPELPNIEKMAEVFGVSPLEFYKTPEENVKKIPMSYSLNRALKIPDKVYDLADELGDSGDEVWDDIEKELMIRIEERKITKKA